MMWEKGGIRWEKVMGWEHGVTHMQKKGENEFERRKAVEEVAKWLFNGLYT